MSATLRVVHVSHSAQEGGSNTALLALIRYAPAGVEQACVFLEDGPVLERLAATGVPCALVDAGRARELWRAPGVVRRLRGALRRHRADVVLAHVSKAQVYASPAAALEGVTSVWWQQEHLGLKPALQALAGRLPAAAVVCSATWTARAQAARFPHTPVHRIHLGIEPRPDVAGHRHTAAGSGAGDPLVLGVVGRIARWKRVELALQALPAVRAALPGATLRVLGAPTPGVDEGYEDELRARAADLGVLDIVDFAGHQADGPRALAALDLLVHCARDEPFGLVLAEALAAGVPVVAPNEGGPLEIVRDGVDGRLVDVTDAQAFADAIVELGGDPARREAIAADSRRHALEHFGVERMAAEAWALLRAVR